MVVICVIHKGRRDRVKERFLAEGASSFAPHEILELLLFYAIPQKDTNVLAHNIINHFGSLDAVLEASYSDLCSVPGVGSNTAILINLVLPTYSAYMKSKIGIKPQLKTNIEVYKYCNWLLKHEQLENFYAICLNSNFQVLGNILISKGSNDEVKAYPKLVASAVIRTNASHVILCHNHPSGNCNPSKEDENTTILMDNMLNMIDVKLIDHVIVSSNCIYSMKNRVEQQIKD